jgi:multidrug efflux pump subunit AcrA (membrane-fusion protein)
MTIESRAARSRIVLFAAVLATGLDLPPSAEAAGELPTATAQRAAVQQERSYDGTVEAERRSTVSAQVSARIEQVPFDVDDYVERGDIIVQFRDRPVAAQLKQAEAAEQEAQPAPITAVSSNCSSRAGFPGRTWIGSRLTCNPQRLA